MSVQLKVKNEHTASVDIVPDNKTPKVTIAAGSEASLGPEHLTSKSLAVLMEEGKISFVKDPATTPEQFRMGRLMVGPLIKRLGQRRLTLHSQLKSNKKSLATARDSYNNNWTATEKTVQNAKASATPTARVLDAAKFYLTSKPEEDAIAQIQADIATLEAEDLSVTGRTLQEWYADRQAKQAELEAAQKDLAAVKTQVANPLKDLITGLETASVDFAAADPATDIGSKIAPW